MSIVLLIVLLGLEWADDWGTKILTERSDESTTSVPSMKPIQLHQHDTSSDSNISRPISVAHGRLPIDFTSLEIRSGNSRESLPNPPTRTLYPLVGDNLNEKENDNNDDDVIRHRHSRLKSL